MSHTKQNLYKPNLILLKKCSHMNTNKHRHLVPSDIKFIQGQNRKQTYWKKRLWEYLESIFRFFYFKITLFKLFLNQILKRTMKNPGILNLPLNTAEKFQLAINQRQTAVGKHYMNTIIDS